MRRIPSLFLAAASLLGLTALAVAATRPHYGGTLVVETSARIASLDPAHLPIDPARRILADKILFLIGDRLIRVDGRGARHFSLATGTTGEVNGNLGNRDWTFELRSGVKFSDGAPLTTADVVHALGAAHPDWKIANSDAGVQITLPQPMTHFWLELGLTENSILRRDDKGLPVGTGPFRITEFTANEITLAATEDGWRPPPFLDGVKILMGRSLREQWIDFQLGRADVVEISPSEVRRARSMDTRLWWSEPEQVIALAFLRGSRPAQDSHVRQALAAAVNRPALADVLLQKVGQQTEFLLPEWLSGFPVLNWPAASSVKAPSASSSKPLAPLVLSFDSTDSLLRGFAERIAVDARAGGVVLHLRPQSPDSAPSGDVRLVRVWVPSLDPARAFREMVSTLDLADASTAAVVEDPAQIYQAEQSLAEADWLIPLVDLPEGYAIGPRVRDWQPCTVIMACGWQLQRVWKEPE